MRFRYKPRPLRRLLHHGALAQLGERMTGSHEVTGSIPISSIGALAQLGERMTGSHEVTGSIPISSTLKRHPSDAFFFYQKIPEISGRFVPEVVLWV